MSGTLTRVRDDVLSESASPALTNKRNVDFRRKTDLQYDVSLGAEFTLGSSIVGGADREQSFQAAIARVRKFSRLPVNWDTYGGVGAAQKPVEFAVKLLQSIRGLPEVAPPEVCPIDSGVYLEWQIGDSCLYFEVDEDSVLYVMRQGDHVVVRGEDRYFGVLQAERLVQLFQLSNRG